MQEIRIIVGCDGTTQFIANDELRGLISQGWADKRRASHVVPLSRAKRIAFQVIRALVPDSSRVAAWTRNWRGPWVADMAPSGGPVLMGPSGKGFDRRVDAIEAEVVWINENLLGGGGKSGRVHIALMSDVASSTGTSLHDALREYGNQVPVTLQTGWSTDEQTQMFGRTHRSNQ